MPTWRIFIKLLLIVVLATPFALFWKNCLPSDESRLQFVLRFDDIYLKPNPIQDSLIGIFKKAKIPFVASIIPYQVGPEKQMIPNDRIYAKKLREMALAGETDIFMHGLFHRKTGQDEFSGLPLEQQSSMIEQGKKELKKQLGLDVTGFAPPWNGYDRNTTAALSTQRFSILSSSIHGDRSNCNLHFLPATCYAVSDALKIIEEKSGCDGIVVLLIHSYSFQTEKDFKDLSKLLTTIKEKNIQVTLPGKLQNQGKDLSCIRLRLHHQPLFWMLSRFELLHISPAVYYSRNLLIPSLLTELVLIFMVVLATLRALDNLLRKNWFFLPALIVVCLGILTYLFPAYHISWKKILLCEVAFATAITSGYLMVKRNGLILKPTQATSPDSLRASFHKPS